MYTFRFIDIAYEQQEPQCFIIASCAFKFVTSLTRNSVLSLVYEVNVT